MCLMEKNINDLMELKNTAQELHEAYTRVAYLLALGTTGGCESFCSSLCSLCLGLCLTLGLSTSGCLYLQALLMLLSL